MHTDTGVRVGCGGGIGSLTNNGSGVNEPNNPYLVLRGLESRTPLLPGYDISTIALAAAGKDRIYKDAQAALPKTKSIRMRRPLCQRLKIERIAGRFANDMWGGFLLALRINF